MLFLALVFSSRIVQMKSDEDWEVWNNLGQCHTHLKQFELALEAFERSNSISRHDTTYLQMGKASQKIRYYDHFHVYPPACKR